VKISELLLEDNADVDPFSWIKTKNKEFKDLAAECGLTLQAGMGWPAITKAGGWFGGGLGHKGGNTKAAKADAEGGLPINVRTKAFLHLLAKKLEDLMAAGHVVKVAPGAERARNVLVLEPGSALEALTKSLIVTLPPGNHPSITAVPCVAWFVSLPTALAAVTSVRFNFIFMSDDHTFAPPVTAGEPWLKTGEKESVTVGGSLPTKEAKQLEKDWNAFWSVNNHREGHDWTETLPRTDKGVKMIKHMYEWLKSKGLIAIKGNVSDFSKHHYASISLKTLTKDTKLVDMKELETVIRKYL
jgi:hypothetical protein